MAAVASQQPTGFLSGISSDANFQPLDLCGVQNPFFYHVYADDFDNAGDLIAATGAYTPTGTGSVALTPATVGGAVTISALTASFEYLEITNASFTVNIAPKKFFYQTRVAISTVATATFVAGMFATGANPISAAVNGVYFKWVGGTGLSINVTVASATVSVVIPAGAYTMANATNIDLAFAITRIGDVLAYVDTQLVGYIPQSNINTPGNPQNAGAVARMTAPTLPSALLTPTLGMSTTAGTTQTMTVDFQSALQER
jgi:hypothetical protein